MRIKDDRNWIWPFYGQVQGHWWSGSSNMLSSSRLQFLRVIYTIDTALWKGKKTIRMLYLISHWGVVSPPVPEKESGNRAVTNTTTSCVADGRFSILTQWLDFVSNHSPTRTKGWNLVSGTCRKDLLYQMWEIYWSHNLKVIVLTKVGWDSLSGLKL